MYELAPHLLAAASSGVTGSLGAVAYGLAAIGPGVGIGLIFGHATDALAEALALIGLVVPFVFGK